MFLVTERPLTEYLLYLFYVDLKSYLIFPLKLCPHGPELRLCARRRHDVVHDVDVNVVKDDNVPVASGAAAVVHDVTEDDPVLGWGHLHVGFDAEKKKSQLRSE